ncbi:protein CHROMATIN REMODELING 20-like isoform X1 [Triticum dicoccoides]|uniref:protein CHROMATIN REMODELING 20-like isoform X1 n=1 Tax=Triticum dicoccoides TaxID=85692 RepID=UPI00188DF55F|nr:protein CHROMATIN REMODELING 20-like isoform X1 [Triticum dicoccoides]
MDVNGKLSDGDLNKTEALHSNGQPVDDVIIIESEGDENKVVVETNIIEGPFEEHKEHRCGKTDNSVHEEASTSTDDDSDSDLYGFLRESENEQTSESDVEETDIEVALPEEKVEELVAEFHDVESKAAEAQESLEKESLEKIEAEVRLELSERLQGDALDLAVAIEMEQFKKEWSTELDDLEIRSAVLLEELDAAGVELPSLYKSIESQAPNVCETEAWKNRTHWAGSQVPEQANLSIRKADEYLQSCRPVRRKHGRLLEEGASGFLAGKVPLVDDDSVQCHEKSWSSFNELIKSIKCAKTSFGSSNWASVYLANTPQEAAALGLQFPGVDEVEEIAEVDGAVDDIKCVDEIELSEEQRRKYRKVREEDDAKAIKRLRRYMEKRTDGWCKGNVGLTSSSNGCCKLPLSLDDGVLDANRGRPLSEKQKMDKDEVSAELLKRTREDDVELDHKRSKTIVIESDDDMQMDSKLVLHIKDSEHSSAELEKGVDIIDLDLFPSQSPKFSDMDLPKSFKCTICTKMLNASDVHRHPVLDVAVCGSCRFLVIEKNRLEGPVSGGYCTWCVQCEQLLSCSSCKMLFCTKCLLKNLGEKCISEAKVTGWQCCCCQPSQLEHLVSECDKALSGVESSDLEGDNTSGTETNDPVSKHKRKKKIRRIMDDTELGEETKRKIAMEKARQEHLKSMHEQSASKLRSSNIGTSSGAVLEVFLQDAGDGHIVNPAREEDEEPVRIPSSISAKLKPHQVAGIIFMWENVIQSVRTVKSGDKGFGCILAHNMGLGKTFQVITFLYVVMRCAQLGLRTALIVTPVNVLHNWKKEFTKWQPAELKPLRVYMLEDVPRLKRLYLLNKWRAKGGVLLIGYSSFRNLSLGRHVKEKDTADEISNALQCGPDILVCDEAHMIKNRKADTTHALKQVKTQRRIALTGSPLQNNLMEYYCMVDFVREGFLGSSHEFRNRFQNPIENGQHTNSTSDDVKIMNQRSHILYEQLKGFVQRMDMNVVKNDLPPKKVFVIIVKLSQLQRKLYRRFLDVHGFSSGTSEKPYQHGGFFAKYQKLAQIWNHPGLLQMAKEQRGSLRREDAVENFLTDESSSDDNHNIEIQLPNGGKQKSRTDQQSKKIDLLNEESNWWENLLDDNTFKEADYSGKMVLLLDILATCYELGDKALVFSQNLTTLDLVEFYLSKMQIKGKEGKYWKQGKDWYRLDGSTPSSERQNLVERFNDPANTRVKCTLISTRAGSLGINLHAANRVVLLDGSWNPTHDLQAIYRVWRYGQMKPVYAYRLMAHGTMEEKIYKRQVTKEGLAARVVDRQQVSRTISKEEMLHLFEFGDEELLDESGNDTIIDRTKVGMEKLSMPNSTELPVDTLMLNLLSDHPRWIAGYHEHEVLLQENEEERLTKEEQDMAWSNFKQSQQLDAVARKAAHDHERKPIESNPPPPKVTSRSRQAQQPKSHSNNQKKCTNLNHMLTLRSHGTKAGCTTSCDECGQTISWETLNRSDGRLR